MSSPTGNNKRKADALSCSHPMDSDDGGGRPAVIARLKDATSVSDPSPTTPHIPPPVWGRVLDFMPYEEVRSALLVGKIMANEAVKYVRVLNFMKSCELDGPSAQRFASIEEVNCLCLLSGQSRSAVLCKDTTIRLVPLLTTFAKLKHIYVGGLVTKDVGNGQEELSRRDYGKVVCSSPENHEELFMALFHSFLGAFKARVLPSSLVRTNIITSWKHLPKQWWHIEAGDNTNSEGMCVACRDVFSYFPILEIMLEDHIICNCPHQMIEMYEIISNREGAREIFQKASGARLPAFLEFCLTANNFVVREEALRRRLADLGMSCGYKCIYYLTMADINELDRMIAFGFDPGAVSKESLYEELMIGNDDRQCDVYAKSTIDALVARGFPFAEADLILLDERMESALKDLAARIYK